MEPHLVSRASECEGGVPGPVDFFSKMLNNQIVSIYWFFIPLFGIYLSMPLLSLLVSHRRLMWYLAGGTFLLESVLPYAWRALGIGAGAVITISSASSYVMFVILGYLFSTEDLTRRRRTAIYMLGVAGLLVRFVYTLVLSEADGQVDRTFFNYIGFPSVLLAVAVFVFARYHNWSRLEGHRALLAHISGCSFGVYLVHYPVLNSIVFKRAGVPTTSVWFRVFGAFALYCAFVLAVRLARRVPVVRRLFP